MVTLIPTSSALHLARRLAKAKDIRVVFPDSNKDGKRVFPDGEAYARLSGVSELFGRVVLLVAGVPKPNTVVMELEMLLSLITHSKAHPIEIFFTYFPYSMQDHEFEEGERNVVEDLMTKWASYYNVTRFYAIDGHFEGKPWLSRHPLVTLTALGLLQEAATRDYADIVFLAPDKGAQRRTGLYGFDKTRVNSREVSISCPSDVAVLIKDKTVGIIDDLLETGGTLAQCAKKARECGAHKVVALVTHGVLSAGIKRVLGMFDGLYLANTVKRAEANVDVSGIIRQALLQGETP